MMAGEGGGGHRKRGRFEWGKISLLAWFTIAIVWLVDGHPGRLMYLLVVVQENVFVPFGRMLRSLAGG